MGIFDEAYGGTPNWEIGRPQREFVTLEETGEIRGDVLDVGCGSGENALFLAGRGHKVVGVDSAVRAIELAREKARERDLPVTFLVQDALAPEGFGRTFDTIIDSGLFHALSDAERPRFLRSLAGALRPGGVYFMLALSDLEPGEYGPRRITQQEIRAAFGDGWRVNWIRAAVFEGLKQPAGYRAWLSSIARVLSLLEAGRSSALHLHGTGVTIRETRSLPSITLSIAASRVASPARMAGAGSSDGAGT
jgi:SAM-dependent methyltransferase